MKLKRVFFGALALALVATSCGGSGKTVATANGDAITQSQAFDQTKVLAKIRAEGSGSPAASSATPEEIAETLTSLITNRLVLQEVKRLGLTVTDDDRAAARDDLGEKPSVMSKAMFEYFVQFNAAGAVLTKRVADKDHPWFTDADIQTYYDAVKDTKYLKSCTRHILVADQTKAADILSSLKRGASFDTLASDSLDTSNKDKGGDLGCQPKGSFVAEFEDAILNAKAGDLIGPVKTEFGYHVIRVDKPYAVQALDDTLRKEIGDAFFEIQTWFEFRALTAKVTIDAKYGTWDGAHAQVAAPSAATPTTANAAK